MTAVTRAAARRRRRHGRIGAMHAELLAHDVPGAALAAVYDPTGRSPHASARGSACDAVADVDELIARGDVDAVAICSSTDTHADLMVAAADAGKPIFVREAGVARPRRDRPRAGRRRARRACRCRSASTAASTRRTRPCTRRSRRGAIGEPHIVRISSRDPAPAAAGVRAALGRHLPRHDDPRLRHGALRDRSEVVEVFARGAVRIEPELEAFGDMDTAVVTLVHDNGVPDGDRQQRQAVYGYDQRVEAFGGAGVAASENPPRAQRRSCATRTAPAARSCRTSSSSATWRATSARGGPSSTRCGRRAAAGGRGGRPRAAGHRPGGVALAARGPARTGGRGRCLSPSTSSRRAASASTSTPSSPARSRRCARSRSRSAARPPTSRWPAPASVAAWRW